MARKYQIWVILLLMVCAVGCSRVKKYAKNKAEKAIEKTVEKIPWVEKEGDFYTRSSGWDYARLPLIEPYEATNVTGDEWLLDNDLINPSGNNSAGNISKIGVSKPYIFIYCDSTTLVNGQEVDCAWYIINADKNELSTFLTEKECNNYLSKRKITLPEMYEIDSLWNEFDKAEKLPWTQKSDSK